MTLLKTQLTPAELCQEFWNLGDEPPRWALREAGLLKLDPETVAEEAKDAGVPERYATVEPDYQLSSRLSSGESLYLHGPSGDGKTTVAAAAAAGWIASGKAGIKWISSVALMARLSDTWSGHGSESAVMWSYANSQLLIVDDLGKEQAAQWVISRLFWLIDERYAGKRPTIITTQYSLADLAQVMAAGGQPETAQAIASRIRESYSAIWCGDQDRRLANAGKAKGMTE